MILFEINDCRLTNLTDYVVRVGDVEQVKVGCKEQMLGV